MASGSTYDYVVSFSEKGMNKMFEDLFSKDLQLSKLAFSDDSIGTLNAVLLPPQVVVPDQADATKSTVICQLRIKSGTLTIAGLLSEIDVSAWVLAVQVNLQPIVLPITPGDSDLIKEWKRLTKQYWEETLSAPGDYSVERLFAKVTHAYPPEVGDFNRDLCTFGTDAATGKLITYQDLVAKGIWGPIETFLGEWAQAMARADLTVLGYKINPQQNPWTPIYPPTAIKHVCNINNMSNHLVYCEMTQNKPFGEVLPEAPLDNPASDSSYGLFRISRELLIDTYLVPQLRVICEAFELDVTDVWYDNAFWNGKGSFEGAYGLHVHWDYRMARDDAYAHRQPNIFALTPKDGSGSYALFYTKDTNKVFPTYEDKTYKNPGFFRLQTFGTPTVSITWGPKSNQIHISASLDYHYNIEASWSSDMSSPWGWLRETLSTQYSYNLTLQLSDNGVLAVIVEEIGFDPEVKTSSIDRNGDVSIIALEQYYYGRVQTELGNHLLGCFGKIAQTIAQPFNGWQGQMVLPGNGQLMYSNATFDSDKGSFCMDLGPAGVKSAHNPISETTHSHTGKSTHSHESKTPRSHASKSHRTAHVVSPHHERLSSTYNKGHSHRRAGKGGGASGKLKSLSSNALKPLEDAPGGYFYGNTIASVAILTFDN